MNTTGIYLILNLALLSIIITLSQNDLYAISLYPKVHDSKETNLLEIGLTKTKLNETSDGYICMHVPISNISENGYRCEPCEIFPGLCNEILSNLNTTKVS